MSGNQADRVLKISLTLNEYPILSARIRHLMRKQLFARGVLTRAAFDEEARSKAIQSQHREGLKNPFAQEASEVWEERLRRTRDVLTDFYYAYNLPYEDFEALVRQAVSEGGGVPDLIPFNPELAPQDMLFQQGEEIERLPARARRKLLARLQEIKVVLIRTMISDQLAYLNIARTWFTMADLREIYDHKIGYGKIGGKSAGMLLAYRILRDQADEELRASLRIPVSYFLASDLFYTFMAANDLIHWSDQKYKPEAEMRAEYPEIVADFVRGRFPQDILARLERILEEAGDRPLIVRSSSLLEDNFGTSFAGKYDSYFCANQGSRAENLSALTGAVARVYASCLNPNALLYRHQKGLVDYDERIAILLQFVEGERFGDYFLPQGAGVAFSRNLYRWSPQIRKEDGFLRLVWGLGTRAVEAVGDDQPRLVALSHPLLHPADSSQAIGLHSQRSVDLLNLKENRLETLPVHRVLTGDYPAVRAVAQTDEDGYLDSIRSRLVDPDRTVITFDGLLRTTPFAARMRALLQLLERHYHAPVDTEFTLALTDPQAEQPGVVITLLQCRPQSTLRDDPAARLAVRPEKEQIVFSTRRMVPSGRVTGIGWVLYVSPDGYFQLDSDSARTRLVRAIGRLNSALAQETFICLGPGRWGTSTPDLGVGVTYGDIYHTRALVELTGQGVGPELEPSFGTHFFQDLLEAHIFPLHIHLSDPETVFRRPFFEASPNHLLDLLPEEAGLAGALRLIRVRDVQPGASLSLVMDDEQGQAVAFLEFES